jgi:hypothetical protein
MSEFGEQKQNFHDFTPKATMILRLYDTPTTAWRFARLYRSPRPHSMTLDGAWSNIAATLSYDETG